MFNQDFSKIPQSGVISTLRTLRTKSVDNEKSTNKQKISNDKKKLPGRERWKSFIADWKKKDQKERASERDALNTETMLSKVVEMTEDDISDLEVCDFFIARFIKDKEEEKYHDHAVFVKEKDLYGIKGIFISDIMKDKSEETIWPFETLRSNMKERKLAIIKFNFMDLQDEEELILERAEAYEIPKKETRPLHFAYLCAFGVKEPVFSCDHLSLCENNTLLLLRTEDEDTLLLLHKAEDGQFHVSQKEDDTDIKILSYEELMNMAESRVATLYYYPQFKNDSLEKLYSRPEHGKRRDVATHTVEVSAIHTVEESVHHSVEHAVEHSVMHVLAPELATMAGLSLGAGLHGLIAVAGASISTHKIRKKEKNYKESGGLQGFSRTRRNKELLSKWSGSLVGVAGSIGAATLVGQVLIPVPGIGAAIGMVAGGVIGGLVSSYLTNKSANKIYNINMRRKCPLCPKKSND